MAKGYKGLLGGHDRTSRAQYPSSITDGVAAGSWPRGEQHFTPLLQLGRYKPRPSSDRDSDLEQPSPDEAPQEPTARTPPLSEAEELQDETLRLLDYDTIRGQLADNTTFYEARRMALGLRPSFVAHEVEQLQDETADARGLLDEIGELSLESGVDTSESVDRAALDGILTGVDLLAVADTLEVHRRARSALLRAERQAPLMADLAGVIPDLQELQRQIRSKIGPRGEVVDDATVTLRALRTQVRQAYDTVTEALNSFIRSSTGGEALQEPIVSVRGDRLVVPVKSNMRHRVRGIVHDASNTGATVFIEPFETVELCNAWRELALEEEREVTRVLRDLSTLVGAVADDIRLGNHLTGRLDFALARARYSHRLQAVPAATRPSLDSEDATAASDGSIVRLLKARHPMLGPEAVPLTFGIGPGWTALVVTGPNTGGKTVAMKTVGLLALMHQSGIQIPADEGSALPVFDGIYVDIGDQQSIAESVSTFGSHMANVIKILKQATPRSLVLLDELGSSTDPEEGSALAKAIVGYLAQQGVPTVVTTHHRTVAAFAETVPNVTNASFQLDPDTLEPTYELIMGVPGRSYAMAVAERLGLPGEIMAESRALLEPQHLRFEDWLNELQRDRQQLQSSLEDAEGFRAEAESLRSRLDEQVDYLIAHRDDMLDSTRREVATRFDEVERKLRGAEASLSWVAPLGVAPPGTAPAGSTPSGNPPAPLERIERIRRDLGAQQLPAPVRQRRIEHRPIGIGDTVFVRGLNLRGSVTDLSSQTSDAEVAIGNVRINVDLHRLARIEPDSEADAQAQQADEGVHYDLGQAIEKVELDLRGLRVDEALMRLEDYLDSAVRDGVDKVRIIHGRGTGALRDAVREHLQRHPSVNSYGPEPRERGGNGATYVELA